jgi:UDP-N-acetylglucosamine/UDP-N-acetylgalactosamine diphosphorylase
MTDLELQAFEQAGQGHLLQHRNHLCLEDQKLFDAQLQSINPFLISELYTNLVQSQNQVESKLNPAPFPLDRLSHRDPDLVQSYIQEGENLLKANKVAAFLVAGGQGSRLGFEGPKGAYDIGLPSHKSLFQLHAERLINLNSRFGSQIPWVIMTSPLNHQDTLNFFKAHFFFGYPQSLIHFFSQGMIPAIDESGKILLESPTEIALVPDGNGGCFRALKNSGIMDHLLMQNIEYLFLYSVDNALVKICDPLFIGYLHQHSAQSASKVVAKKSPEERVGIFVINNGLPGVIEYSDLDRELAFRQNEDQSLLYDGGNIAVHLFKLPALAKACATPLPWHKAYKKVNHFDIAKGVKVEAERPNAYKFEQFMFDIFPELGSMAALEVQREEEFAPVKNAEGADSPLSAVQMISELHRKWLINAGHSVAPNILCEVSPLLSYAGENLQDLSPNQWQQYIFLD